MTAQESTRSFWERTGLSEEDGLRCMKAVRRRYVEWGVEELAEQGYCSLTLHVYDPREGIESSGEDMDRIVQIRSARYALDMGIARAAKETYTLLAPSIRKVDLGVGLDLHSSLRQQLCVYEMQKMQGTPLSRVSPRSQDSSSTLRRKQERLIESFATMIAQGLKQPIPQDRSIRADSPMEEQPPSFLSQCLGKVGSTITSRLEKLRQSLPEDLSTIAIDTLARVKALKDYPVVLNHGDLIPSNIIVDQETWQITGLVDWAEAEHLPFGTCLYGLEWLVGHMSTSQENGPTFRYYESAPQLRELFWHRLCDLVPWLKSREADVRMMRKLGILLWYGFAWDDGAIDRVVNDVDDPVEMACLRAFLDVN